MKTKLTLALLVAGALALLPPAQPAGAQGFKEGCDVGCGDEFPSGEPFGDLLLAYCNTILIVWC